eukprot:gene52208-71177_t
MKNIMNKLGANDRTRTVDDTALMMRVLSLPDDRDGMNLPPATIDWSDLAVSLKGVRIGLMLDLGFGLPLDQDVRDVAIAAAKTFEAAGAIVTDVPSVMTGEHLIGLDAFWRARSWDDMSKLSAETRAKILPT